jgi:hypothetical protein
MLYIFAASLIHLAQAKILGTLFNGERYHSHSSGLSQELVFQGGYSHLCLLSGLHAETGRSVSV